MAKKIIGIDLGTTNSVVAIMEGRDPKVIDERGGQPAHAVGRRLYQGRGESSSGRWRSRQAITNPENTVYSIKRFMGRKYEETTRRAEAGARIKSCTGRQRRRRVKIDGKQYSPAGDHARRSCTS